ncbi:hypothetical protein [uncultured Winogradskyella sp.]|uniref:hypothetical protein n=1 Tax=uncultured Winogradskyella sp. TaxID=395353 RepID=UPI002636C063|nr:hypothetical protein [uncultured Winogradskyella sp.]
MKKTIFTILTVIGLYSCNDKKQKELKDEYYYDIYAPNDLENNSGTTTDKQLIDYNKFKTEFKDIDWDSYPANPTISVYKKNTILWVALYATSDNSEKLQMFLVGHHYKEYIKNIFGKTKEKDFSTTHFMIGKDKVLPLFELYFKENNNDGIIKQLKKLDKEFKNETSKNYSQNI